MGQIVVFSRDTDLTTSDIEYSHRQYQVGYIHWSGYVIQMVAVEAPGWGRQGIATELWRLASGLEPELQHSRTHVSAQGAAWIRSLPDYVEDECPLLEHEWMPVAKVGRETWWRKLLKLN
ncbi:hypothetical protein [Leucobacter chromiireducens]|uniref:hypothetical protein n=1 Tax=Leucobacter chromiireducens TaxID=283877 RepID=UPI003F7F4890